MSALNIGGANGPKIGLPNTSTVDTVGISLDRAKRCSTEATKSPDLITTALSYLALFAAAGVIVNASFELADAIKDCTEK